MTVGGSEGTTEARFGVEVKVEADGKYFLSTR